MAPEPACGKLNMAEVNLPPRPLPLEFIDRHSRDVPVATYETTHLGVVVESEDLGTILEA